MVCYLIVSFLLCSTCNLFLAHTHELTFAEILILLQKQIFVVSRFHVFSIVYVDIGDIARPKAELSLWRKSEKRRSP